jgi:antitoxin MazE
MATVIKTRIVRIGNSQGVRIPKLLLEQSSLGEDVELAVEEDRIVIRAAPEPRGGWEEAFRAMVEHGDDALLDDELEAAPVWDEDEWEW